MNQAMSFSIVSNRFEDRMKTFLPVLILIAASTYVCVFAQERTSRGEPRWELVATTDVQSLYRSTNPISRTAQGTITAWEKIVPRMDTAEGRNARKETIRTITKSIAVTIANSYSYYSKLEEYDCDRGNKRTLQFLFYNERGKIIHRVPAQIPPTSRPEWFHPLAGSIGERLVTAVCQPAFDSRLHATFGQWIRVTPANGRFSVSMPNQPMQSQVSSDTLVGRATVHKFVAELGREAYMVLYADYPPSFMDNSSLENMLNAARDSTIANTEGMQLVQERRISLSGHPGREFVGRMSDKEYAIYRIFWLERRLYTVVFVRTHGNSVSSNGHRFFESFEFVPDRFEDD